MSTATLAMDDRARLWSLAAVITHMLFIGLTLGISFPLTSLILEAREAPGWQIGLAGSMPALGILIIMPLAPRLVGRIGAIPAMCLGCIIGSIGLVLMPLLPAVEAWFLLRFLMGIGLALPWLVGETWINTVSREESRGRVVALYTASLFVGFGLGPVLLSNVGLDGWTPFLIAIGAVVGAMLPLALAASKAPKVGSHAGSPSILNTARVAPLVMAGALVAGFAETASFSLFSVYGLRGGLDQGTALQILTVLIAGGVVLQYPIGFVADRVSRRLVLAGLCSLTIVIAAIMPAAFGNLWSAYIVAFVLGGMVLGFYSLSLTILGERYPVENLALANAAFLMLYQAGGMAGPASAGAAMDVWDPHGFVVVLGGLALLLGVWALVGRDQGRIE